MPQDRCPWAGNDPLMRDYHDTEWGVPVRDPRRLWEALMLEGFQAGLSWQVILRKREAFRAAFAGFDPRRVAAFDAADVDRLMGDAGIVRSRAKIEATIRGARIFEDMREGGEDFASFCWSFVDGRPLQGDGLASESALSRTISTALKRRGFKFVGPTIAYAWMQAVGLVNDHAPHCFRRRQVQASCRPGAERCPEARRVAAAFAKNLRLRRHHARLVITGPPACIDAN